MKDCQNSSSEGDEGNALSAGCGKGMKQTD